MEPNHRRSRAALPAAIAVAAAALALLGYLGFDWFAASGGAAIASRPAADSRPDGRATEAAVAPRAEAKPAWSIRVVDAAGAPLPDSQVYRIDGETFAPLGATAADGVFRADSLAAGDVVLASHAHCIPNQTALADADARDTTIRLAVAGEIRGRVVFERAGIGGVTILATPTTAARGPARLASRALANDPAIPCAVSGADGRFSIDHVAPDTNYSLYAGGAGFGMPLPKVNCAPSAEAEAELAVLPVFATAIHFVGNDGAPLEIGRDLAGVGPRGLSFPPDVPLVNFPDGGPSAVLAGIPARLAEENPPDWRVLVSAARAESAAVGPFAFTTVYAGYEPVSLKLELPRIRGKAQEQEKALARLAAGFAHVSVELRDLPDPDLPEADRAKRRPLGTLEFTGQNGAGSVQYYLWGPHAPRFEIDRVPYGVYEVCYSAANGFHNGARTPVTIDRPSVEFSLSALPANPNDVGGLLIRVKNANGTDFDGRVTVALRKGRNNATANIRFDAPPYVFPMLPAKKLQLTVIPELQRSSGVPEYLRYDVEIPSHRQMTLDAAMTK